jgi:hypothetical protein
MLGTQNMTYKRQYVFFGKNKYGCLRGNAGNTEHDLQETAHFFRTIDMAVRDLMLETQNMTYKRQHISLGP